MKISVYLHSYVVDTLRQFGDLSDVVNRILEHGENDDIIIFDRPKTIPRDGAGRYDIDVHNEYYLQTYSSMSPTSPKTSLRRLLYWFVDEEIYDELEWMPSNEYTSKSKQREIREYQRALEHLERLSVYNEKFVDITNELKELKELL